MLKYKIINKNDNIQLANKEKLINNLEFNSKYINSSDKKYFLENFQFINIYKGRINEIAFIKKK